MKFNLLDAWNDFTIQRIFSKVSKKEINYKCLHNDEECDKPIDVCEKLVTFYDAPQVLLGNKYPTSNVYFPNVFDIRLVLNDCIFYLDLMIKTMTRKMLDK